MKISRRDAVFAGRDERLGRNELQKSDWIAEEETDWCGGAAAGRIGCSLNKSPWTEPGRRSQSETVGVRLLGRLTLTRPPG